MACAISPSLRKMAEGVDTPKSLRKGKMTTTLSPPWSNTRRESEEVMESPNKVAIIDLCWDENKGKSVKKRKRTEGASPQTEKDAEIRAEVETKKIKKIKDLIVAMDKTIRNVSKHISQNVNTKKEIKEGITALRSQSSILNTEEIMSLINKMGMPSSGAKKEGVLETREMDTNTNIEEQTRVSMKSCGTQTECLEVTEEERMIEEKIEQIRMQELTAEKIVETVNLAWPSTCYKKTKAEKGSILDQESRDVVIIADMAYGQSKLLHELAETNTKLGKIIKEDKLTTNKLYTLEQCETLSLGDEEETEKLNRHIYLVKTEPDITGTDKILNVMDNLKKIKQTTSSNDRTNLAFGSTSSKTVVLVRRLIELMYREEDKENIYIYGTPTRGKPKIVEEEMDKDTEQDKGVNEEQGWQLARKGNTEVIKIRLNNDTGNYADMVKSLKRNIDTRKLDINVKSLRRTKEGTIQINVQGKEENRSKFREAVQENLGNGGHSELLKTKKTVFVKDLDECTLEEEIIEAFVEKGALADEIKITLAAKTNRAYRKHAFVTIDMEIANQILRKDVIRIGWMNCRVEEADAPVRCFKCSKYGHAANKCESKTTMEGKCFNCCGEGHLAKECRNEARCYACKTDRGHKTQSMQCPVYRRTVQEWRRTTKTISKK